MNKRLVGEEEGGLNLKPIVGAVRRYLYLFVIFVALAILIAFLINRYSQRIYHIQSTLLIKDEGSFGPEDLLQNLSISSKAKVENERIRLASTTLAKEAISRLDFDVSYISVGQITTGEIYNKSPFLVKGYDSLSYLWNKKFQLKILDNNHFLLTFPDGQIKKTYAFGDIVSGDHWSFTIVKNEANFPTGLYESSETDYEFFFNNPEQLAVNYSKQIAISNIQFTSVLQLAIENEVPEKGADYLNALMDVYIERNVAEKSTFASQTINFIEDQLAKIESVLDTSENSLEDFKESKGSVALGMNAPAESYLRKLDELDDRITMAELEIKSLYFIQDYVKKDQVINFDAAAGQLSGAGTVTDLAAPSALFIKDEMLGRLLGTYNVLLQKRDMLLSSGKITKAHPEVEAANDEIANIRESIFDNIKSNVEGRQIIIREYKQKLEGRE